MLLPLKFQEILMLKPKRSIFKNYAKTLCFCAFFEYQLMSVKHNDDVTTISKKHKKSLPKSSIFLYFWLKFWSFSASMFEREILRSWGGSWPRFWGSWGGLGVVSGRLGPHLGRLGPHFGAKEGSHTTQRKKLENQGSQNPGKSKDGGTRPTAWRPRETANS